MTTPSDAPATEAARLRIGAESAAVVAHLPFDGHRFLGSPSILRTADGGYLASHDVFGRDVTRGRTSMHASPDGDRWEQVGELDDMFWGSLFVRGDEVYLIGTTREYGALVIRRSTDGGRTWSVARDARSGLLSPEPSHTAPVPIVLHGGRYWRAFERRTVAGDEWGEFAAAMMSADADADLLDAASWHLSAGARVPYRLLERGVSTWLEGNVVVAPDDSLVVVIRANAWSQPFQQAAVLTVLPDGELAVPHDPLIRMPGGGSKFTIRRDPVDGAYWSLVNTPMWDASVDLGLHGRNTLSLARSTDLRAWEVRRVVLHHPDDLRHGYQYCDWLFEGGDVVFVSRTAHEYAGGSAHSYHDSNLITFHRLEDFRA